MTFNISTWVEDYVKKSQLKSRKYLKKRKIQLYNGLGPVVESTE